MTSTFPSVFAVKDNYQIFVPSPEPSLMWVKVGDKCYYDHSNGILRSNTILHKVTVPMTALDGAGEYTVCTRKIIERKPYFPTAEDTAEATYKFRPLRGDSFRAYHISDSHNMVEMPIAAAEVFGDIDLLVLNGDVPNHSGAIENFMSIYEISGRVTKGEIPCVFSRGNHDMRGFYAENIADYTPTDGGKSYFTFRLGSLWGIVLDCGEDKPDTNDEYGGTICCHQFRLEQTEFIKKVIANAENEYLAEGVTHRVVIAHNPFTKNIEFPFNIERELYGEWARLLKQEIKPEVFLAGHFHLLQVEYPGCPTDALGHPCPVIIGGVSVHEKCIVDGRSVYKEVYFGGAGFDFAPDEIKVTFTTSRDGVLRSEIIKI